MVKDQKTKVFFFNDTFEFFFLLFTFYLSKQLSKEQRQAWDVIGGHQRNVLVPSPSHESRALLVTASPPEVRT